MNQTMRSTGRAEDALVYTEWRFLRTGTGQRTPIPDDGPLLVSAPPILQYEDTLNATESDKVSLYPAIFQGKRAWVKRAQRHASGKATGQTDECILYFEVGVRVLINRGCYEFPQPKEVIALSSDRFQLVALRKQLLTVARDNQIRFNKQDLHHLDITALDKLAETVEDADEWRLLMISVCQLVP